MYATMQDGPGLAAARAIAERQRVADVGHGLPVLEDQVCAEAGVWAPDAARRAIAQAGGDVPRAVALLRVWAATLPHLHSCPVAESDIRIERRISSAYPEIPGGQWLGFAPDLAPRILSWDDEPEPEPSATPVPTRPSISRASISSATRPTHPRGPPFRGCATSWRASPFASSRATATASTPRPVRPSRHSAGRPEAASSPAARPPAW